MAAPEGKTVLLQLQVENGGGDRGDRGDPQLNISLADACYKSYTTFL
jgi:hypothetical protein